MVKHLATSPHDPLGITDSACKNQLVVVSVQYGLFNPYIPIRSTTIGKSRVAIDPIAMHTSWRSNSDIASVARSCNRSLSKPEQISTNSNDVAENHCRNWTRHPLLTAEQLTNICCQRNNRSLTQLTLTQLKLSLLR
ncbi:putative LRR receptor-like serine/threonine-protein kinase [Dorcoceras hygrometricum]|uniref:Putative LRR receptor-like serine/threonine-protein kinase n=1 Tax=Dorcoceras hygrometricum TaxID=472368 RepID=A0A2Z7AVR0_9LAMI|nr:putative LRR receptor-like serine/threonine-protein kinase [Dorcoceras hygrometricum]